MNNDSQRVHYYFVCGAFGGLTGWFLGALLLTAAGGGPLAYRMLYGALLGAPIGGAVSSFDGAASRRLGRLARFISLGVILGALAGVIALPLAQVTYDFLLTRQVGTGAVTNVLAGALCWAIFGGVIGFGQGLGKGTQSYKGALGGALGGLSGGALHETARASLGAGTTPFMGQCMLGLSLSLLGGFIGASIAFMTVNIRRAWLEVLTGEFAGLVYDVTKYVNRNSRVPGIIGSDERRANIYLTADQEVLPLHARIDHANGIPTLTVIYREEEMGTTLINGRRATTVSLEDGDRIQIGSAMLIYRNKYK